MKNMIRRAGAVILVLCLSIGCAVIFAGCSAKIEKISGEKAIELALGHFGLNSEDCTVRKVELDEGKYEIEIISDKKEYDIEIDAYTGKVRERDVEYNDHADTPTKGTTSDETSQLPDTTAAVDKEMITKEKAIEIAMDYFQIEADSCTAYANLDRREYEVTLVASGMKYEADIDAYTGKITETDIDNRYD